jgi:hypothetical protein
MPMFTNICRYSFEISTKARRDRSVGAHRERSQTRQDAFHVEFFELV